MLHVLQRNFPFFISQNISSNNKKCAIECISLTNMFNAMFYVHIHFVRYFSISFIHCLRTFIVSILALHSPIGRFNLDRDILLSVAHLLIVFCCCCSCSVWFTHRLQLFCCYFYCCNRCYLFIHFHSVKLDVIALFFQTIMIWQL